MHVVALEDKVNPVLIAIVINGMNTFVIYFDDFTDWKML